MTVRGVVSGQQKTGGYSREKQDLPTKKESRNYIKHATILGRGTQKITTHPAHRAPREGAFVQNIITTPGRNMGSMINPGGGGGGQSEGGGIAVVGMISSGGIKF